MPNGSAMRLGATKMNARATAITVSHKVFRKSIEQTFIV